MTVRALAMRAGGRAAALTAPAPLTALGVLLLNDLYLKGRYANALTGKLSDFAGLFLFTAFWIAVAPRWRSWTPWAVALAWICWKTPVSAPLVAGWNALGWVRVGRVEDASDLLALVMVPLAAGWRGVALRPGPVRRMAGVGLAAVCMLAFAATSIYRPSYPLPGTEYPIPLERVAVLAEIHRLRLDYSDPGVPPRSQGMAADTVLITLPPGSAREAEAYVPWRQPVVTFEVADAPRGSTMRLLEASGYPVLLPDTVRGRFEERVVERLLRGEASPYGRPPLTAGADEHLRPRILHPLTAAEPRERVAISLARSAHVALIEVTSDERWHVIYPATPGTEALPGGESELETDCPPEACVPQPPLSPRDSPPTPRYYPGAPPSHLGRLLILAADARIDREALQALVDEPDFPRGASLVATEIQARFGELVRARGGRRAAASEIILRR